MKTGQVDARSITLVQDNPVARKIPLPASAERGICQIRTL
jgi:hypothetical protein